MSRELKVIKVKHFNMKVGVYGNGWFKEST